MTSNYYTWKEVSSPVKDPAIVAFQRYDSLIQVNRQDMKPSTNQTLVKNFKNNNNSAQFPPIREVGYIEKLLHSYGFIQCCNRQNRLFFHFSEVVGRPESFQVGDVIEFQQTHDKRTGKPVASVITKIPEMIPNALSMKPATGVVLSAIKDGEGDKQSRLGQLAYEQNGETFFIPFSLADVESKDDKTDVLKAGDCVEFYICTEDSGVIQARKIVKMFKTSSKKSDSGQEEEGETRTGGEAVVCQGVVCSFKDNFGFIERADVVKEIFFHFTEFKGKMEELSLGDDVQFNIELKNHKEVAVEVKKLPEGTVIFEDVADEKLVGQVTKALHLTTEEMTIANDPVFGRILYQSLAGPLEILYGERDRVGDFTLLVGDLVQFHIATDRRDKLQRATNIKVLDASFTNTCEKRSQGFVISVNEYSGFICSISSNYKILFHMTELLDPQSKLAFLDEVQFSVAEDIAECKVAIRIKKLPAGTIEKTWKPEKYFGVVHKRSERAISSGIDHFEAGVIKYEVGGQERVLAYYPSAVIQGCRLPIVGDLVEFQISNGPNKEAKVAANIKLKDAEIKRTGFVADIKDGAVWIELIGQTDLISFKSSLINSSFHLLKVGDEIEFVCSNHSIDNICLLVDGTIPYEPCVPLMMEGKVVRCINSSQNCDTDNYCGLIQLVDKNQSNNATLFSALHDNNTSYLLAEGGEDSGDKATKPLCRSNDGCSGTFYSFRICSLIDRRDVPSLGELVRFQPIDECVLDGKPLPSPPDLACKFKRAGMVVSMKRCLRSRVNTITSERATLNYQLNDGSNLCFRVAEVTGVDAGGVQLGDLIEFVGVSKNDKFTAIGLHKLGGFEKQPQQRPDRLMSRLRSDDSFQRIVATRQPKGPDLGKGFSVNRTSKPKPSASYNSTDAGTSACKTPHQSASSTSPVSNSSASHDSSTSPESLASHNVVQASEDRAGLEEV